MRRTLGLATAAVLAAGTARRRQTADGAPDRRPPTAVARSRRSRRTPARPAPPTGQAFRGHRPIVDPDGTTHVRMERTYRRPPRARRRPGRAPGPQAAGGASARPWPRRCTSRTTPTVDAPTAASARRWRPPRPPAPSRADGHRRPRASSSTPPAAPRAWRGRSSAAAPRPTARPAGSRRTSTPAPARCSAREQQIETVDGSGQSLYSGTVPLQLTQSGSTYQLKDPTRGSTYTTDMNNKADSLCCQIFGVGCTDRHAVHQPRHRRSATARPAAASRPRSTRSTAPT